MNNSETIRTLMADVIADGTRQLTLTGDYEINETILLPSDFTLILENCHLTMAEGSFCNIFRNENAGTAVGKTKEGTNRNIRIIGRGKAILDGGVYNGLSERNHSREGKPHISVNNLVLFANVEGFAIENLHCRNQRWWALNFLSCGNGRISGIDFCSDDTVVLSDGRRVHGLHNGNYLETYIRNSDGIDLRAGCHDILIENITGFTEDDTVALTGLCGSTESLYCVSEGNTAIRNIIIRNVQSASRCTNVRLLNQGGVSLCNILIDGVMDASEDSPHMGRGIYAVRVGDDHMYGSRHSTPEETKNITIRNVYGRGESVVQLAGAITNLTLDNICSFGEGIVTVDNRASLYTAEGEITGI